MDFNDAIKNLKGNPELAKSLEEAIGRNADIKELVGILVDAGFDSESAEALVAEYQRRRGLTIADNDLDENTLKQVAGGGSGVHCSEADDCDNAYKDPFYWNSRCDYSDDCDEFTL